MVYARLLDSLKDVHWRTGDGVVLLEGSNDFRSTSRSGTAKDRES